MDVSWNDALIRSLFVHRSIFVLLNRFQLETERRKKKKQHTGILCLDGFLSVVIWMV